jgi:Zn-dependent protease
MSRELTVGRLFGIRFIVDASWLIMFALLSWTVSTLLDAYGPTYSLGAACIYSLLLFASVIAHELGHALVARSYGVHTSSIALFLFGGVATLDREPETPEAEIRTAVAGPLISVALSLIFFGCARMVDDGIVHDVLAYLALGNAAIAAFNIIPAFPMDGGRVLRAMIWAARKDRLEGTIVAASFSAVVAVALCVGGLYLFAVTHRWQCLWYALLSVFLARAAWNGYAEARVTGSPA